MQTQTIVLDEKRNVSLTTYLWEDTPEMQACRLRPAVLVIPGGAYKYCSNREGEPIAFEFMARGYQAFILRYSINEDAAFPTPLEDAKWALRTIRDNAEAWRVQPDKIVAIGASAGGHLTASLAVCDEKPNAAILLYPCTLPSISPILAKPIPDVNVQVDTDTPPTFIVAAADDGLVPVEHSLAFASALDKAKVPFELHIYSRGSHGFSTCGAMVCPDMDTYRDLADTRTWMNLCFNWLENTLDFWRFCK